ncbi:serine/threonine-protein kinase [Streptomyces sp. NPDC093982]|uniref:serine/threonine-protein kinase n=1 Tax=Streptomyces sp. NPDC093982 TaxID=3155077 RepID=UPI00343BFCE0
MRWVFFGDRRLGVRPGRLGGSVKVLREDHGADNDRQVARFAREAAVAGGLSHPHIVTVHDFGSATYDGRFHAYLVMELLRGKPLSIVLKEGRLPLPDAVRTAVCIADALGTAHGAGLTHRDIKPSNIIVRPNGKATVVDFGITKSSDERHDITTSGVLIGTPAYMASASTAPSTTAPTCTRSGACSTRCSLGSNPSR